MSYLRDPHLDPDDVLEPDVLIDLEAVAQPQRDAVATLSDTQLDLVRRWLAAELQVVRGRAEAVGDHDFVEYTRLVERRFLDPGSFLRDAQAWSKIRKALAGQPSLRVLQGGKASRSA